MQTCTWAPTTTLRAKLFRKGDPSLATTVDQTELMQAGGGSELTAAFQESVGALDGLIDNLLVPQRWYGTANNGPSSFDVFAMSTLFAACTTKMKIISAIHPGFTLPAVVAKWGATMDRLSGGRWGINVVSGWKVSEFASFGADLVSHDDRYARSAEFIDILRRAWSSESVAYQGEYYSVDDLIIDPGPLGELEVFQGGQSEAAMEMGAKHSDWMFLNGGSPEKIEGIITQVRKRAANEGREVRFAVTASPVCRSTDKAAWNEIDTMVGAIDWDAVNSRRKMTDSVGMWSDWDSKLAALDMNEGYATGLIGSPDTILTKVEELKEIGVGMLHLSLGDPAFNRHVLPHLHAV
ncbi:LLM class flavin-dependent oxidoreductase [Georgenia ruanii]|uniref:LLM class flavin-dependent oxidoreductase n=1 Tax=Georgenia ruanii TaxID=348442 RepID=UPI0012659C97|nr:LLM class flavin-dependent oxidoreductase [Georgenia ruanii]